MNLDHFGGFHRVHPTAAQMDLADLGRAAKRDAATPRERRQLLDQAMHAALDVPHTRLLDMRHEHQGRGRCERRRTAIGRIAAEQLPKPGIGEVVTDRLPQGNEGLDVPQIRKATETDPPNESHRRGAGRAHEGAIECREHPLRMRREAHEGACLGEPAKAADGIDGPFQVRVQIQPRIAAPRVPREELRGYELEPPIQIVAGVGEQLIEHGAQREHRGTGVQARVCNGDFAQFAPRRSGALEQHHLATAACQIDGCAQAGHSRPDHRDARARQKSSGKAVD